MFEIRDNILASNEAKALFPHVGCAFEYGSMGIVWAVARILYGSRTSADEPIRISYAMPAEGRNTVQIRFCDDVNAYSPPDGWKPLNVAGILARYKIQAKAYISRELQSSVIVASWGADARYLLSLLPRLTPWAFHDAPPTEWEKKFVYSLLATSDADFLSMVDEYARRENLSAKIEGAQLTAFLDGLLDAKTRDLEVESEQIRLDMVRYEEAIRELLTRQTDVFNRLLGIRAGHNNEAIQEFKAVFMGNPNCHVIQADKSTLVFGVVGFITNFNETTYQIISRELHSTLYDSWGALTNSREVLKCVYDELFLGDRYRINTYGAVELNLECGTAALSRRRIVGDWIRNAIPNPHMVHYHCPGGFGALYNHAMQAGDYAEVLEIAFSEVQNVNWADSVVVRKFADDICSNRSNTPCIWDKQEKQFITPCELAKRKEAEQLAEQ